MIKRKNSPKHSNDIHFFLVNAVLVAGLMGMGAWLQRDDQPIVPAGTTGIKAVATSTASDDTVPRIDGTTTPALQTSTSDHVGPPRHAGKNRSKRP